MSVAIQSGKYDEIYLAGGDITSSTNDLADWLTRRVLVIRRESGRSALSNVCVSRSACRWIRFLSPGDTLLPAASRVLMDPSRAYDAETRVILARIDLKSGLVELSSRNERRQTSLAEVFRRPNLPIGSVLFRRDALEAVGGLDENIDQCWEWEALLRLREVFGDRAFSRSQFVVCECIDCGEHARWKKYLTAMRGTKPLKEYIEKRYMVNTR